jgi:hypothetical protein
MVNVWRDNYAHRFFWGETKRMKQLGKHYSRRVVILKSIFKTKWIYMSQDRKTLRCIVNPVMKFQIF